MKRAIDTPAPIPEDIQTRQPTAAGERSMQESLRAEADTEYQARIEAERCTLEFASKIPARSFSFEDSPLAGGQRQGRLF